MIFVIMCTYVAIGYFISFTKYFTVVARYTATSYILCLCNREMCLCTKTQFSNVSTVLLQTTVYWEIFEVKFFAVFTDWLTTSKI